MHTSSRIPLATLTLASTLSVGCATAQPTTFRVLDHALFVHADGRARATLEPEEIGERGPYVGVPLGRAAGERQLAALMEAVRRSPHDTILIYLHGGRISYDKGYARVAQRGRALDSAGYYPIFVNWNSSSGSNLWWHVFRMRQGQDWGPWRGTLSAPFVIAGGLGRAISRAPLTTLHQFADYCRSLGGTARGHLRGEVRESRFCPVPGVDDVRRRQAALEGEDGAGDEADSLTVEPALAIGIGSHDNGWTMGTVRVASGLLTLPAKLVLAPIADGFGAGTMSEMRRRATSMIHARREFTAHPELRTEYQSPQGILHALVDSLHQLMGASRHDSLPPERRRSRALIVVGHSMGTLVIDQILEHFPDLEVSRIIYLAPATTVAELEAGVVRYLERNPRTTYYHGMLHPYADAGEWQPGMLDLVPRGSLLEWMDDYLTAPDTPLDRVSGKWSNLVLATHIFSPAVRPRVVLKAFGVRDPIDADDPALYAGMHRHAGFSDPRFAFWDERTWLLRPYRAADGAMVHPKPPGVRAARVNGNQR